ncbi:MAG: thiamine pyrophosphate-binding protein, partial [Bacillota bacterium]
MQGAELLVRMLEAHDVRYIFGLPGDTSMSFYDALKDSDSIRHVMGRDERSCGFMADAYARLSGRPGVTEAPSGAGAAYLYPSVLEADGSSIPLVALTSDVPLSSENRSALTAMEQVEAFRTATRFSSRLTRAEFIPHSVRTAFRAATGGRMGAAHLAFPEDVLSAPVDPGDDLFAPEECSRYPAWRTRPDPQLLERAAGLLLAAERPLILAGGGVILSGAMEALREFAEQLGIGVVTTMEGKGSMREDHPLALGVIGANGAKAASNRVLSQSDVVLALGSRLNSTSTWGWTLLQNAAVIQVDADPMQLGNNLAVAVSIQAD